MRELTQLSAASFNIGYMFGPVTAGVLADAIGIAGSFTVLGILGVIVARYLMIFSREQITINVRA